VRRDLQDAAPLGEVGPVLLVLGAALHQAVQPWGHRHRVGDGDGGRGGDSVVASGVGTPIGFGDGIRDGDIGGA